MGYQEAYISTNKKCDFENFTKYVKSLGKDYFDAWGSYPVEIITFTKNHYPIKKGDKTLYFVGERFPLHHIYVKDEYDNSYFLNKEFDLFLEWTEEVESNGIWEDSGEITDCIHERFIL